MSITATIEAMGRELDRYGEVAVAVSGGIDSLTLSALAHARLGSRARMFHSLTASVPAEATRRTRDLAKSQGWTLEVIDARELSREEYLANPVDRCFFCKQSLYAEIARHTQAQVLSGANADDLRDYRPGLDAARQASARHPFVDLGVDKAAIRAIARAIGLGDLAEIPASPCLSSRVETGIRITPPMLASIERAENVVREHLDARSVRCRVRGAGIVIELEADVLASMAPAVRDRISDGVREIFGDAPTFAAYRMGSAFLRTP